MSKKAVVEGLLALDTTDLKRLDFFAQGFTCRDGSLSWRRGEEAEPSSSVSYTLTVNGATRTLRLRYKLRQAVKSLDYPIQLVATGCHLGGVRWWFICPLATRGVACGRRVRKLHLHGDYFGCRHCHRLTYTSSQQSDSRVYAAVRGGLEFGDIELSQNWSVSQLGFALKVLTFEQLRLDRITKRLGRNRRGKQSERERRGALTSNTVTRTSP